MGLSCPADRGQPIRHPCGPEGSWELVDEDDRWNSVNITGDCHKERLRVNFDVAMALLLLASLFPVLSP